ncbi:MAG: DUF11 domain-containing protein [Bifidobacteriaceae bacterium]|nr:DUF11 domain-containing protein [Bifidobacteriaceae bacterium]
MATQADLSVTKTSNKSYVPPLGESVDYTVTVTNNGPSVAQDVVLKDTLPEGMTVQDVTPASGTCTTGTPLTCNFGPMSPESSITVTIKAKVDSTLAPGPITQTVRVESATDDPELGNNQATWTHVGEAAADLLLEKTSTGLAAGEPTTYTLKVTNNGPQDAHNLTITDTLPSDLTRDDAFAEANPLPNGCSINGQVVTCQVTTLDDGISQEFEIKVMVPPDVPDGTEIANTATVAATTEDPNPSNNTATEVDAVISETDLVVDYEIGYWINDPDDAQTLVTIPKTNQYTGPGSVRYAEIRVTNAGPAIAQGFQIRSNVATTAIPDQASFPGWCHSVNQELICSWLSDVAPGTVIRFNLPFIIGTDTAAATYADCGRMHSCADGPGGWASVTTSTRETHDDDNFDTAKLEIEEAKTELHMEKVALDTVRNEDGHPAYVAGGTFGYRLELWVPATYEEVEEIYWSWADAADVNLTDTLPEGFTVTQVNTSQGDCSITDPGVSCELGTVVASTDSAHPHKVTVYVYGTVDPDATGEISQMSGAVNTATAESTTKAPGGAATKVTAMAETDVVQHVDLSISKLPDSPVSYAGGMVGYTLTVLNAGPSAAADVKVTDTLPEGLKFNPELSSQACHLDSTDPTEQKVECALSANWSVEPGASESFRIVASTSPRDLRAEWCDGRPDEENITCPEVLPPEDLTEEHPRTLQNKAEVATSSTDTNMDDNSVKVPTVLDALADFAVTASVSTDTPSAGSTVTYTMNGVNLGPSTLDNPVVEARFPPGFVLVSVEQPFMDCQSSHTGEGLNAVYTLRCIGFETTPRRDSFLPGFTIPGTVTMYIPPNTPAGSYDAEAWVYSRNRVECPDATAGTCESDYSNNAVAATVNVVQAADTSIVKRLVTPIPVVIGQPVTYELTATNAGPSIAGDVTISDTVPAGLTYVSGQAVGGAACPLPERIDQLDTVRCQIGSLAPGESAVVSLTFRVDATFTGEVCNSAIVGSSALDYSADDNTGTTCSPTIPAATDVAVTITAPNAPVPVGAQATYTAVVENRGPWPTTGAVVTFTLPPGLTDVEVTAISRSDGAAMEPCVVTGRQAVCQVGDLATGGTAEYRITGTAVGQSGTSLMVEADVKHDLTDTDLTDDHAAAAIQLSAGGGTGTPTGPSSPGTPPGSPSTPPTSTPPAGGDTPPASPSDPPSGGDSGKGGGSDDDDDGIGGEDDDDGDGDGTGELAKSGANMSTPGVLAGLLILLGAALTLRRSAFH